MVWKRQEMLREMRPFALVQSKKIVVAWQEHAGKKDNSGWIRKFFLNPGKFSYCPTKSVMYLEGYLLYFNPALLMFRILWSQFLLIFFFLYIQLAKTYLFKKIYKIIIQAACATIAKIMKMLLKWLTFKNHPSRKLTVMVAICICWHCCSSI